MENENGGIEGALEISTKIWKPEVKMIKTVFQLPEPTKQANATPHAH